MANIIFNSYCNRNCPYCFAQKKNEGTYQQLTLDNLVIISDFLTKSQVNQVSILGGEPTLHPDFNLFLRYLVSRGFMISVFSNGMIGQKCLRELQEIIAEWQLQDNKFRLLINVNEPKHRSAPENRLETRTFRELNQFISLSFNIFEPSCHLDFLVDLIIDFNLIPRIRLGLAAPILGKRNTFLSISDYPGIAQKIMAFSQLCQENAIDLVFDCGFPMCMFSDAEIGKLYKNKTKLNFLCEPVIDIDADLNTIYCYPLSQYKSVKLTDFNNIKEIYDHYQSLLLEDDLQKGIYPDCIKCEYRYRGRCSGGCKGHHLTSYSKGITEKAEPLR
jgi:radical SAM protein with 4Fe4S-binding SPASM domain